jgi:c-di-GMP-related signal transduction protein
MAPADLAATAVAGQNVDKYLARQPIFDRDVSVLGYELLFRSSMDNFFKPEDASKPAESFIDNFLHFGLETLTGGRRAFINFTQEDLIREIPTLFPPDRIAVEIVESTLPDPEVISACRRLKQAGYLIALDDYTPDPGREPLLPFADIIKVDFRSTPIQERKGLAHRLAPLGTKLLAEKVETHEDVQAAREAGYSYFQGYFYCKPQLVSTVGLKGFKPNFLHMLQAINRPELNLKEIEGILKQEPALLYRLLRYLNSAYFSMRSEIASIRHAIALLGKDKLRKWASVVVLAHLAQDKPSELIITSLVRARFCELLAVPLGMIVRETDLFLLGLLSSMDAILGRNMPEILRELPLSEEVKMALLNEGNRFRRVLLMVLAFESGAWKEVHRSATLLKLDESVIAGAYLQSIDWTARVFRVEPK